MADERLNITEALERALPKHNAERAARKEPALTKEEAEEKVLLGLSRRPQWVKVLLRTGDR